VKNYFFAQSRLPSVRINCKIEMG